MRPRYAQEDHTHASSPVFDPGDISTAGFSRTLEVTPINTSPYASIQGGWWSQNNSSTMAPDPTHAAIGGRYRRVHWNLNNSSLYTGYAGEIVPGQGFNCKMWFGMDATSGLLSDPPRDESNMFFGLMAGSTFPNLYPSGSKPFPYSMSASQYAFGVTKEYGANAFAFQSWDGSSTVSTAIADAPDGGEIYCLTMLQAPGSTDIGLTLTNGTWEHSVAFSSFPDDLRMFPMVRGAAITTGDTANMYLYGLTVVRPQIPV